MNDQHYDMLSASLLHSIFEKPKVTMLLNGEGGSGKTSLACQIGLWAMEEKPESRLCETHLMIPLLIEVNLKERPDKKNPFFTAIRSYLSDLTGNQEPLLDELVYQLLKKKRVLIVVDSFSELDETTQAIIRQSQEDFLAGALVVTTRDKNEILGGSSKTIVNLPRLRGKVLASFLQNYLCQRLGRELIEKEDRELFTGCTRLTEIIGDREITVLIAKMYAELMLAAKLNLQDEDSPHNIPDLMKNYVRTLNDKVLSNKEDTHKVIQVAQVIAWECLKQSYRPSLAKYRDVLQAVQQEQLAPAFLKYLEESVPLVQTKGVGADQLKFFLDPLAEYLAAIYLLEHPNNDLWNRFLSQASEQAGLHNDHSFVAAVLDCYNAYSNEFRLPDKVKTDLNSLASQKRCNH